MGPLTPDALYGIGGVSFRAPPGARARFGTAKHGHFGRKVSRFEIDYLEQPGGGKLKINLDGKPWGVIDTERPGEEDASKRPSTFPTARTCSRSSPAAAS